MRLAACAAVAAAIVVAAGSQGWAQGGGAGKWVTAWSTSHHTLGPAGMTDATVRLIARSTISGNALQIRLANTLGTEPLQIGKASIAWRTQGASVVPGSSRPILFNGAAAVTIAPGATVTSDRITLAVSTGQDLAISLHVPGAATRPTQHTLAFATSYLTADGAGDLTANESREPFTRTITSTYWLKAIDVLSPSHRGSVVAFGDSITDGNCSTVDGHDRWVDWLAVRLALDDARSGGKKTFKAVINEGISGNTIGREGLQPPPDSPPGLERLERDVLSHQGVTDVILFMGTNDIRRGAPAAQVIAGYESIAQTLKKRGLRVVGSTIIPRHNNTTNSPWDAAKTATRHEVNRWIREKAPFDGVIDFDRIVRDAADPDRIQPAFNCDEIHPTARGYYEMGTALPLKLFQR